MVRTMGNPTNLITAIRHEVQTMDKNLPVFDVKTLTQQVGESLFQERLVATLTSFFGLLALLLASIGLYGIMSHAVVRRTNEIGIPMVLGALSGDVLWLVLRETLLLVLIGVGIGLPVALVATRLISRSSDSRPTLATLLLLAVGAVAGYLPARRASRVDPMVALRCE